MRIFLDANILFSAVKSDGAVHAFVAMLLDAGHECWVDGYVVDEARRNIMAKAPGRLPHLDGLVSRVRMSAVAPAAARAEVHGLPEKDRLVLAAAIALGLNINRHSDAAAASRHRLCENRKHIAREYRRFEFNFVKKNRDPAM